MGGGNRNGQLKVHRLIGEILDEHGILDTETIYQYVANNYYHAPSKRTIAILLAKGKAYEQVESNKRRLTLWQRRV